MPLDDPAFDYKALAEIDDYGLLMAYDEHAGAGDAGPVASQDWFAATVERRFDQVACREGGRRARATTATTGRRRGRAPRCRSRRRCARPPSRRARIALDADVAQPDLRLLRRADQASTTSGSSTAVTGFNQLREALAVRSRAAIALWRLGSEDPSFWSVLERRSRLGKDVARRRSRRCSYGYDIDYEGQGEILQRHRHAARGHRGAQVRRRDRPHHRGARCAEYPVGLRHLAPWRAHAEADRAHLRRRPRRGVDAAHPRRPAPRAARRPRSSSSA